ncbi:hypothetical protein QFC20_007789 [Naganishia adeliensis]|uniref:Uncharacterized protein n=1 Tax=Naganishia adeliensis TaxID=92952 RepID=A0ACC2UVW7_9TREE|nr:hypothetical protein QFC20_007789 [Naganishia adeliensis]
MKQETAVISDSLTIAYRTAGDPSNPCILLIHGYPQTSYMYRHVLDPIAAAGYYVFAPDYRGAGDSSIPEEGYDKFTMARDLRALYTGLGVKKVVVVGIDIGSMVATALALQYRDEVVALFASECPQPGTSGYEIATTDDTWKYERWAEKLTEGKERFYIKSFYDRLANDPSFLTEQDLDEYERAFTKPGAMHAGFEVYRAFLKDGEDVKKNIKEHGKMKIPVLASGGESSPLTELSEKQMTELADNVTFRAVPKAMHWIPEENPEWFVEVLVEWLKKDLGVGA